MKRLITSLVLIALILIAGLYSLYRVKNVRDEMILQIETVSTAVEEENLILIKSGVEKLCAYWKEQEGTLIHYVRHTQIDDITKSIARLPAMAAYQTYDVLFAELNSIRWQIDHIWKSEIPSFDNILARSL